MTRAVISFPKKLGYNYGMRIGFFELEGWEESAIRGAFPGEDIFMSHESITAERMPDERDFDVISVFVNSVISPDVLAAFPNLKCVATRSTGYDHIDLTECARRGITVLYVPGYGDNTVAEFAFGLILNLTRKMYQCIDQIKETGSFSLTGLRGIDIKGKTLGVVGTGRIGKEAVKIAKGFGMNVVAYDMRPDEQFAKDMGISYVTLDDLLAKSDVITIHCPYTKETHHLINAGNVGKIKRGAYLVNTARGAIVETAAVVPALEGGALAGYGADVLEEEGETKDEMHLLTHGHPKEEELKTMLQNHMLMKMPNVLLTPHNAFNSTEALGRILRISIENVQAFRSGAPINVVK